MDARQAYKYICSLRGETTIYEQVQEAITQGKRGTTCHHRLPDSVLSDLHNEGFSVETIDFISGEQVHNIWWGP